LLPGTKVLAYWYKKCLLTGTKVLAYWYKKCLLTGTKVLAYWYKKYLLTGTKVLAYWHKSTCLLVQKVLAYWYKSTRTLPSWSYRQVVPVEREYAADIEAVHMHNKVLVGDPEDARLRLRAPIVQLLGGGRMRLPKHAPAPPIAAPALSL
jgi:hypothetical protein